MKNDVASTTGATHAHSTFLARALRLLQADQRFVGVAAAGSFANGMMDEFSDLDLVIAVEPTDAEAVSVERHTIAAGLGPLVAAFTGEHVGEPRVLICLYDGDEGGSPLHVDLKFVSLPEIANRVDPVGRSNSPTLGHFKFPHLAERFAA
ncbi:MAG: nucleotidyltransferase domain-containing protein [bacterium]|nr:nucleotidyltransferase domain-containing protein [Betaproteobacteria bacterium]